MTLEEAIKNREDFLKYLEGIGRKSRPECAEAVRWSVKALKALRPVSREQAEKVWRGEWIDAYPGTSSCKCTKCGAVQEYESTFCCHCGAPMTDEAVEMVMERLEGLE